MIRNACFAGIFASSLLAAACGDDTTGTGGSGGGTGGSASDGGGGAATTSAGGGAGGRGGAGGSDAVECVNGSDDVTIQNLLDQPCGIEDEVCSSNNGCGGCSVTCVDGVWKETDTELCYSIGAAC